MALPGGTKLKRSSVSKRIAMGLFATALNVHSIVALADASIAGGQSIPPPKDADEIVKNLRDIIDHGDLADEQYFADKLGVVMKGGEIGWMTVPIPCGGTSDPYSHERKLEQRFGYIDVPWYFDEHFGRSSRCDQPYVKEFLSNGLISVSGQVNINTDRVCVTQNDLKKYFEAGDYSSRGRGFIMKYIYRGRNSIFLTIWSTFNKSQCASLISVWQNPKEE
jgi:hypothetical protein